tara:strand:+ start:1040 stop:2344 length:1305 start_codon:yes stop_codon:yes gene_type:complete
MVFGWGKKKQIVEEKIGESVSPTHKNTNLENIPNIIQDITNLRQKTLIAEVKSFQKRIESDRKTLLSIADQLRKDNLSTKDMDPHLVILVNRGKKEVISSIQNEFQVKFSEIDSFERVLDFQRNSSRRIKKVGDMLGKHSRVIHIFAKKYAKKLKDDLQTLTDNLTEVNTLISNYDSNQELLNSVKSILTDFADAKKDIVKQERRKSQLEELAKNEKQNKINFTKLIDEMKSSSQYKEFQDIQNKLILISEEEKTIKNEIEEQFIKISRPLNKYVYVSSLDKPLKMMIESLASSPYDVLTITNKSGIDTILNSVRSGIESGSVSVKDIEKSKEAINKIQNLIPTLIKQKLEFTKKISNLSESLNIFDNNKFLKLASDLEKSNFNMSDIESKISIIQKQIESTKNQIHDMISKLELNLKQASSIHYKISYDNNDL